ncbi:MAG: hypothetical protein K5930_11345 [Treponemataceae bacterium]|nr:hypothetical protein [Treponemataceae bacterium]
MRKFEYMRQKEIDKKYDELKVESTTQLFNILGAQGWEFMPEPHANSNGGYFAKRDITDEPPKK